MEKIRMLWVKAFHIIAMVAWFAGLFYLPRLFVYHARSEDEISLNRFITMESRLYYAIMWPSALLTTLFGFILLSVHWNYYLHASWMHMKLGLVVILWSYHLRCGYLLKNIKINSHHRTLLYYRIWNEIPTFLLIAIVIA